MVYINTFQEGKGAFTRMIFARAIRRRIISATVTGKTAGLHKLAYHIAVPSEHVEDSGEQGGSLDTGDSLRSYQ